MSLLPHFLLTFGRIDTIQTHFLYFACLVLNGQQIAAGYRYNFYFQRFSGNAIVTCKR